MGTLVTQGNKIQKPSMTTLICFALKEEAAPFRKIAAGKSLRSSARR